MPPAFLSFVLVLVDVACEEVTESFSRLPIVLSSNNMAQEGVLY